ECATRGIFAHGLVILERTVRPRARADPARNRAGEFPIPSGQVPCRLLPVPVLKPCPGLHREVGYPAALAEHPLPTARYERRDEECPASGSDVRFLLDLDSGEPVIRLRALPRHRSGPE